MKRFLHKQSRQRAQSMVEFAFSLPVLLLILVGLMEVANLIGVQSRLLATTREGARIGAAGGTDSIVSSTALQSVEGMLNSSGGQMEVWVVRPTVIITPSIQFEGGSGWGSAVETCIYPLDSNGNPLCKNPNSGVAPSTVLNDIKKIGGSQTSVIDQQQLVVVAVYYEARSILALPYFNVASKQTGRIPMRSYSVMRQEVVEENVNQLSGGCSAYPIALNTAMTANDGSTPLNASEGDIFANKTNSNSGFLYLRWKTGGSVLSTTLAHPGSLSLTEYINPNNTLDTQIQREDWVEVQTPENRGDNLGNDPFTPLSDHLNTKRTLRVILFDQNPSLIAGKSSIQVTGFAIVRISLHNAAGTVISFEYVRADNSCGFN